MTVTKKLDHRGEPEVSRKTFARGRPGRSAVPVVTSLVCFFILHARLRVRLRARLSLRPLKSEGQRFWQGSDAMRREKVVLCVFGVITGLVPVIHVFFLGYEDMDGRVKPGHDES